MRCCFLKKHMIAVFILLASLPAPAAEVLNPALTLPGASLLPLPFKGDHSLPVTVRVAGVTPEKALPALREAGFVPLMVEGRPLGVGGILVGSADRVDLPHLAALPFVRRIDPAASFAVRPMDTVRPAIGLDQTYADYTDDRQRPVTGHGQVVCIDDSRVDLFHPAFFKADGGSFSWMDVNGNHQFDPGVDAVDLNGDQSLGRNELLRLIDAGVNEQEGGELPVSGLYQADLDYLYNDADGNGNRQFGRQAGFDDDSPGFGEMLFTIDDSNGNNRLDEGESLIALKTSKVQKAYVWDYATSRVAVYTRGQNLIDYPFAEDGYISHGTGTAGISASGWVPHRWRGVAYDAELVLVESAINYYQDASHESDQLNMAAGLALCREGGATIALHEYCVSTSHPLDGSSNDEMAITEAEAEGLVSINPTCNYHQSKKPARWRVPAKGSAIFSVEVDPTYPMDGFTYLSMSLRWRQPDRMLVVEGENTDGTWTRLWYGVDYQIPGVARYAYHDETPRGTVVTSVILYTGDTGGQLTPPYRFRLVNQGNTPVDVWGMVVDDLSSFFWGLTFSDHRSDGSEPDGFITTTTLPAGADGGIGIGAHEHRNGQHGLVYYSGRGLRIDGRPTVHVTGTYAQMTPGARCADGRYYDVSFGNYLMFGGTSSSSPLMAGVTALMQQYGPSLDAAGLRKSFYLGADKAFLHSNPDVNWGFGAIWLPTVLDARDRAMVDEEPPLPTIFSENQGSVGERMVFSGAGTFDDRGIVSWQWAVNDPAGPVMATDLMYFIHPFAVAGAYQVSLTVTDEGGHQATAQKTVTVRGAYDIAETFEPYGCFGGCNLWQPSGCIETVHACNCVEGTWVATDCTADCASRGGQAGPCTVQEGGAAACNCGDDPVDGDTDGETADQAEDDDHAAETADATDDNPAEEELAPEQPEDDDHDVAQEENGGSSGGGCAGSGPQPWLPAALAAAMLARRRRESRGVSNR